MAAIDFPTSPTTGQLFSAANGVTYQYNGTLWLVQAGPGGGTGEVTANSGGYVMSKRWPLTVFRFPLSSQAMPVCGGAHRPTATSRQRVNIF